jgi:hypothetical protein
MAKGGRIQQSACAAALLAVALLGFAYVQSLVMQMPGDMPGRVTIAICTSTGMAHVNVGHGVPSQKPQTACPYCAAAAHAPVPASVAPMPASTSVAWISYVAIQPLGPRGPPGFAAKARGPPQAALTI